MRFGILGPFEVADDQGREVALGGRKQRSVLAILLLHAGEVVTSDRLIDELWGEHAPATAAKTVQVYVSNLRKALGEGVLLTRAGGYLLQTQPEETDLGSFEALVAQGRGALRAGDPGSAAVSLREALGLWRGVPLLDFAYAPFAQREIGRLEEARLAVLEDRIDAELALGEHAALVGELETLAREQPLRERLHGQLMLALYRAGRQAEALERYRVARHALVDELGIEPGPALRELEQSILRQDPTLEPAPRVTRASASNLPVPATSFLGRARELAEVTALLYNPDTRLLTLTGVGGSGKTRLALRAAEACVADWRDGGQFAGFADTTDPQLIAPRICHALGLAELPDVSSTHRLIGWLQNRELLLVLDNLEHLVDGSTVLGELLASCPGLVLLVTSREPLHLAGECQYDVPVLADEEAIELFIARVQAVMPRLTVDSTLALRICERLDCLPLAIELAAARTKTLSPAEVLARLERRLPVLGDGPRDAPRRQRTLRATIEWSYELLGDAEQRLFARLSVFAGGFTLAAVEAVCDAGLDTLAALVDRSLVLVDGERYGMLETLREYALERLECRGEGHELRSRHAHWFVELLEAEALHVYAPARSPRTLLVPERENFRIALEWATQTGETNTVARLAATLTGALWVGQGQLNEALHWLGIAREHLGEYPLLLQAHVLSAARLLAWKRGDNEQGAELCEQALAIYRELEDPEGICRELQRRSTFAGERGDLDGERAALTEAILFAREHDVPGFVPTALVNLGDVAIAQGRLDEARSLCEESLALGEDFVGTAAATALLNLMHIANLQRRHGDAANLAGKTLTAALDREDLVIAASATMQIAWRLAEQSQPERAGRLLGAAVEFFETTGATKQHTDIVCEQAVRNALRDQLDEHDRSSAAERGTRDPARASHPGRTRGSPPRRVSSPDAREPCRRSDSLLYLVG